MKNVTIIVVACMCLLGCTGKSGTGAYDADDPLEHRHFLKNECSCDIVVTRITKSWYSENAEHGGPGSLATTTYSPDGKISQEQTGRESYDTSKNPQARIRPGGVQTASLVFIARDDAPEDVIHSSVEWEFVTQGCQCSMKPMPSRLSTRIEP